MRSSARARPRVPALMQNLAVSFAALAVLLALLELLLRSTHLLGARVSWATPDPQLGYRFQPGAAYWSIQENDHPITGRINRFGWRDRNWTVPKPAGSYRIAVLGDSFVEALQVEADSTFLALAASALTARTGRPVELMNFGRSGYTQTEELLVLTREVLPFAPDMVLLFFFPGNDIADVVPQTATTVQRPFFLWSGDSLALDTSFAWSAEFAFRSRIDAVKRHSALVSLLSERFTTLRASRGASSGPGLDEYLRLCTEHPSRRYVHNYALNKRLLRAMGARLAAHGARFVIVVLPLPAYMPTMNQRYLSLDPSFDQHCFDRDLTGFGAEHGMAVIGLEQAFADAYRDHAAALNWKNIGHWTYAGHRVVAATLTRSLSPLLAERVGPAPGRQ